MNDLRTAAQALVDRWDTPLWKDVPHTGKYIDALRNALAAQPAMTQAEERKAFEVAYAAIPVEVMNKELAWSIWQARAALSVPSVPQRRWCCEAGWATARGKAWAARETNCGCDHNEYCGKCFPIEFREGGKWWKYTAPITTGADMTVREIRCEWCSNVCRLEYQQIGPVCECARRAPDAQPEPQGLTPKPYASRYDEASRILNVCRIGMAHLTGDAAEVFDHQVNRLAEFYGDAEPGPNLRYLFVLREKSKGKLPTRLVPSSSQPEPAAPTPQQQALDRMVENAEALGLYEAAPRTPNPDEVICPACTHQFRAIPENVQAELRASQAAASTVVEHLDQWWLHRINMEKTQAWQQGYAQGLHRAATPPRAALTDAYILSIATRLFPRFREEIQERFVIEVVRAAIAEDRGEGHLEKRAVIAADRSNA